MSIVLYDSSVKTNNKLTLGTDTIRMLLVNMSTITICQRVNTDIIAAAFKERIKDLMYAKTLARGCMVNK